MKRSLLSAVHVVVVGLVLWPALQTADAVENCKARKRLSDGTISVKAKNVVGQLKWGTSAGAENLPFSDEERCLGRQRARRCFLSDDGVSRRSQDPNTECTVYLADDGGVACSAVIKRCDRPDRAALEQSVPEGLFATTSSATSDNVIPALFSNDPGTNCSPYVESIVVTAADPVIAQISNEYGASEFPTNGDQFLILGSGNPFAPSEGGDLDVPPSSCAGDVAQVDINFDFPPGSVQSLAFDFDFFSTEFPEYVGSLFNDYVFAFLDGAPVSFGADCSPLAATGGCLLTFDADGEVTNVNNAFFQGCDVIGCDAPDGTPGWGGADAGRTGTLNTCSPVSCPPNPVTSGKHTLTLMVGDVGDGVYTTVGLFDNLRCYSDLVCTGPVTCPGDCNDGNVCNGTETCSDPDLGCQPGEPLLCEDNDPCTVNVCDPSAGCDFQPVECPAGEVCNPSIGECVSVCPSDCDDGNPCNGIETCDDPEIGCQPGVPPVCADSDPCTSNECDPTSGCVFPPVECQEGEICNPSDGGCAPTENSPPHCPSAFATTEVLWPPDHSFREVVIAGVGDLDGDPISITVIAIAQDERVISPSDSSCPDGSGIGTSTAQIRAERSRFGDGRVYRIRFDATDGRGGHCRGNVRVCVPRDHPEEPCIDQGRIFDSTGPCP